MGNKRRNFENKTHNFNKIKFLVFYFIILLAFNFNRQRQMLAV